jgi:hypothetical protein
MPSLIGRSGLDEILRFLQAEAGDSRMTFITLILLIPTSVSVTVNSVYSSTRALRQRACHQLHRHGRRGRDAGSDSSVFTARPLEH